MNDCTSPDAAVVIVGAGPAGLACAIAAASHGLQVEVIDGMRPPINKACGEGLMPDSLASLAALGLDLNRDLNPSESFLLRGIRFIGDPKPNGQNAITQGAFPASTGRGVRRTLLHQLLLDRAASLGVRFHWETVVQGIEANVVHTNRHPVPARYIIGADGHQSRVAAWANLDRSATHSRRIGLRQHYAVAPWTDFVEVYWSNHGQAYVTPISANEVCVAYIARNKFHSSEQALNLFPTLKPHLASAPPSGVPRGSITLGCTLHRVTRGNVALIGDASGSVDAITGEGLALCFRQALALAEALQSNNLAHYQRAHRRIQRLPSLMSGTLLLLDRFPRLRTHTLDTFERRQNLFSRLLNVHIGHAPINFLGLDALLLTGLHILTS